MTSSRFCVFARKIRCAGPVPEALRALTNLKELGLDDTMLTGILVALEVILSRLRLEHSVAY